jgi:hypothetical protein
LIVDWGRLFGFRWVNRQQWARLAPGTLASTARHWERSKQSLRERGYKISADPGGDLVSDPESADLRLTPRGLARAEEILARARARPFTSSPLDDAEIQARLESYQAARTKHASAWNSLTQVQRFSLAGL